MRALSLSPDLIAFVSRVWQTSAVLLRAPQEEGDEGQTREALLIDSPIYPDELELIASVAGRGGFSVAGVLATHGDWDHLLGRMAFPNASLGVCESTAKRLHDRMGEAARELRDFDSEHYITRATGEAASATLNVGDFQPLPAPGKLDLGSSELELHSAEGHTADGMAIWVPQARTLICGDYLSPVEIPSWSHSGGTRDAYAETLQRLGPLIEKSDWVVPGHGGPIDSTRALAIWREDVQYLKDWTLPIARRSPHQKKLDAANKAAS